LNKISVLYNLHHLYYLPQFLPVIREMEKRGRFDLYFSAVIDKGGIDHQLIKQAFAAIPGTFIDAKSEKARQKEILARNFDVTVLGKSGHADEYCSANTLAVLLYHGIGVKSCYYTDYNPRINVRYVEGRYRFDELKRRGVSTELVVTGFPKLDSLFESDNEAAILSELNLDPNRATILYAPTFYPSSIEVLGESIGELTADYNLIVKLHHFSWMLKKYRHQKELFQKLSRKYSHVHLLPVEKYSIIPFFKPADILLTEASSVAFEFLATGKPVVISDICYLRKKHRIFHRQFQKKRLDTEMQRLLNFAYHFDNVSRLPGILKTAIKEKNDFKNRTEDLPEKFLGILDGNASRRIVDDLIERLK